MDNANKNYEKFYSKDTYAAIGTLIQRLEQERNFKAFFGTVSGSKTQGLFSKGSDNDFHIFIKESGENPKQLADTVLGNENAYINNELVEVEVTCIRWDAVLKKAQERKQMAFAGYPTNFYRSKEEELKYLPQNIPELAQREERIFLLLHLALFADSIWVPVPYTDYNYLELWKLERTIDAMDTFFVRAYGNCVHFMENQKQVPLRKYLYTLSHIWSVEWLLNRRTKPPRMFADLMAGMEVKDSVRQSVEELIKLNREESLYKTKAYTDSRPELSEYIAAMLDLQKEQIALYPREETLADVILRTPLELRPKLYFEKYGDWKALEQNGI